MENTINQQPNPPRNQSMGELPPVNPIDPSFTPPQSRAPVPNPLKPKRSKKLKLFILGGILIITALVGLGWWYMSIDHAASTTKEPLIVKEEKRDPRPTEPLLTYIGKNSDQKQELLVTDSKQKSIATLAQSDGKNSFRVLANDWDKILVEEYFFTYESPNDTAKIYYTIDKAGKTTKLPDTVGSKLSGITLNKPYFGGDNNIVYTECDDDSCDLYTIDMKSGATTSSYSVAYTPSEVAREESTLELVGTTWENTAWTIVYKEGIFKQGTLTQIDISTKKLVSEHIMADKSLNTPNLSYDYSKIIYTALTDNQIIKLMDTATGKTEEIKPEIPAGPVYYWSFDDNTAAYISEAGPLATAQNNERIAAVNIEDKTVKVLVSYGDTASNTINLGGWSSNTLVHYVHTSTTTPNDFRGGTETIYTVSSQDGSITSNPLPLGYMLVSPLSTNGINLSASY